MEAKNIILLCGIFIFLNVLLGSLACKCGKPRLSQSGDVCIKCTRTVLEKCKLFTTSDPDIDVVEAPGQTEKSVKKTIYEFQTKLCVSSSTLGEGTHYFKVIEVLQITNSEEQSKLSKPVTLTAAKVKIVDPECQYVKPGESVATCVCQLVDPGNPPGYATWVSSTMNTAFGESVFKKGQLTSLDIFADDTYVCNGVSDMTTSSTQAIRLVERDASTETESPLAGSPLTEPISTTTLSPRTHFASLQWSTKIVIAAISGGLLPFLGIVFACCVCLLKKEADDMLLA